jgi:hypothetical protein
MIPGEENEDYSQLMSSTDMSTNVPAPVVEKEEQRILYEELSTDQEEFFPLGKLTSTGEFLANRGVIEQGIVNYVIKELNMAHENDDTFLKKNNFDYRYVQVTIACAVIGLIIGIVLTVLGSRTNNSGMFGVGIFLILGSTASKIVAFYSTCKFFFKRFGYSQNEMIQNRAKELSETLRNQKIHVELQEQTNTTGLKRWRVKITYTGPLHFNDFRYLNKY